MAVQIAIDDAELRRTVAKIRALGELASKRQRKGILRKGAKILRDAAKANVPIAPKPSKNRAGELIQPGFTPDAIGIKDLRKSPDLFVGVVKRGSQLAYWATWLEFGAANVDGSKREGFAFMRRALAATKPQVVAQIIKDADALLKRIVKKVQTR